MKKEALVFFFFLVLSVDLVRGTGGFETLVNKRIGMELIWQKEEVTRKLSADLVRQLLKKPLTVANAVRIALLNNRNLQATFEEIGIAQADLREAVTVPNPSIDFDVQFPVTPNTVNRYTWLIGQQFAQILMIPLKKRISQQALEAAELRVSSEVLNLVAEVKKAYFTLQADQQLLSYLKVIQETDAASLAFAQLQYQAGNTTELVLLQYQAAYNERRLEIADAESLCEQHREDLNILLGLWGEQTNWKIPNDLPFACSDRFSTRQLESLAVSQRFDLQAAHYKVASLASALGLTKTFRWVSVLDFGFSGERDNDGTLNMGPQFRVELPIFNQGQFRVERAQAELRRAITKFEALAIQIRANVRRFNTQLRIQAAKVQFYQTEAVPTRTQIVHQSMVQYHAMQVSPYTLFLTKAHQLETERNYVLALRDYWIARAELERTVGGTLTPSQQSPRILTETSKKAGPSKNHHEPSLELNPP